MNLICRSLSYAYPGHVRPVIDQVDLSLIPGQMILIKGANGSGKSTLSRLICGAIPADERAGLSGQIEANGQDITHASLSIISRYIGLVMTNPENQLFMPSVEHELAFGLENQGLPPQQIKQKIAWALTYFDLISLRGKNPRKCSGGEKQLIVLAAVLLMNRPFVVLDEAFTQIDRSRDKFIRQLLANLKQEGKGIILIDHRDLYDHLADQVLQLDQGKLVLQEAGNHDQVK